MKKNLVYPTLLPFSVRLEILRPERGLPVPAHLSYPPRRHGSKVRPIHKFEKKKVKNIANFIGSYPFHMFGCFIPATGEFYCNEDNPAIDRALKPFTF